MSSKGKAIDAKPGVAEALPPLYKGDFLYSEPVLTSQLKFMLGRILTIIDASIIEPGQNKAIKDLITKEVWERRDWIVETAGGHGRSGAVGKSMTPKQE